MDRNDWNVFMDQVIHRELLDGNTAQEPKKTVRILVCADFEDSCEPCEKFYHFTPVPIDELPPFRLCHEAYWRDHVQSAPYENATRVRTPQYQEIQAAESAITRVCSDKGRF